MASKSDRSTNSLRNASIYNISDLDHMPLIQRRRAALAPLKSFLLAAATVLVVLLTVIVVYLVINLCLVQRQLTVVRLELTSASKRLDMVEKELLRTNKENHTADESSRSRATSNLLLKPHRLSHKKDTGKEHRVSKREASKPDSRVSDENVKLHKGESKSRQSSSSAVEKSKRGRQRGERLRLVWKHMKDLHSEMKSLRNEVAHPSALLVLPDDQQTLNEDFTTNNENAIQWMVDHNSLFETRDSTHLVVQTPGTYFVYLQITYNGQHKKMNPTCSHIVMLENPAYVSRKKPLLYGSSTQYKLGEAIRFLPNGGTVRAIDTVHLSGVFHLTVGDLLYVKPDDFSHHCIVSPLKDKTFFGAFRLQSSFHDYS